MTVGPPGGSDNGKRRRTQDEDMWLNQVGQMKAAIDFNLNPNISALESRLTQLCDQSGWIATLRSESTDWSKCATNIGTALENVDPSTLRADQAWKGGAGDGYRGKITAQRLAMNDAKRAVEGMRNGCTRVASAGEAFFAAVAMHVDTPSISVTTGSSACYLLPPLSLFQTELPKMYTDCDAAVTTSMGHLEQAVHDGFSRVRSKGEGGTGLPDDRVSVSGDLDPWPAA